MIHKRYIIISILYIISITTLIIGTIKEIQWCIIGGVLSLFGSAIISMGIMIHTANVNKTAKPPIIIEKNTKTNIVNPIYETV